MRYVMWIAAVLMVALSGCATNEAGAGAALANSSSGKAAAASAPAAKKELTLKEKVATLVKGKTTYDEAVHILGKPLATGEGPYGPYAEWGNNGWFEDGFNARLDFNEHGILVSKLSSGGE